MPDPSLHCGNGFQKVADQAKNVSWQVVSRAYFQALNIIFEGLYIKGAFQGSRTSLGGVLQGLDVTSDELVNEARKECEIPLTMHKFHTKQTQSAHEKPKR